MLASKFLLDFLCLVVVFSEGQKRSQLICQNTGIRCPWCSHSLDNNNLILHRSIAISVWSSSWILSYLVLSLVLDNSCRRRGNTEVWTSYTVCRSSCWVSSTLYILELLLLWNIGSEREQLKSDGYYWTATCQFHVETVEICQINEVIPPGRLTLGFQVTWSKLCECNVFQVPKIFFLSLWKKWVYIVVF